MKTQGRFKILESITDLEQLREGDRLWMHHHQHGNIDSFEVCFRIRYPASEKNSCIKYIFLRVEGKKPEKEIQEYSVPLGLMRINAGRIEFNAEFNENGISDNGCLKLNIQDRIVQDCLKDGKKMESYFTGCLKLIYGEEAKK